MKTKIIITLIAFAFLYFSELYMLPFGLWYYNECKGIVEEVKIVPGAMSSNTQIKYHFYIDKKEYNNINERVWDNYDYKKGDTITVRYVPFYPTENWCLFEKTLKP